MTDPTQSGGTADSASRPPFPPPAGYPPPPGPPPAYADVSAPYGRHPVTGEPYSGKSKVIAGVLQLIGLVGFVGFGRIYLGQVAFGVVQLLVGLVTFGVGAFIWGLIDAILILSGRVRDPQGRPLRDGT
ncbi:TM2 domain-containing protein [Mycolicibacterium sp. XJ870]